MGQDASAAIPSLAKLLGDKTPWRTWTYLPNPGYVYGMHVHRPVGESAAHALGDIGQESVPALVSALKDESDFVRENAARELMRFSDAWTLAPMVESLQDKNPRVRQAVAYGLRHTRDRRGIEALIAALKDPEASVRGDAAQALGQIGDRAAVIPLVSLLDDPDEEVVALAAWALKELKDERAVEPLIMVLGQAKWSGTRMGAVEALREIGDQRALESLRKALADQDEYVRKAAAEALRRFRSATQSATQPSPITRPA